MRISDWSSDVCSSDLQNLRWNGGERLSVLGVAKTRRQFQVVADIIIEFAEQRRGRELVRILGPAIIMSVAYAALDRIGIDIGAHRQGAACRDRKCASGAPSLQRIGTLAHKIGRAHVCTPVTNAPLLRRSHFDNT